MEKWREFGTAIDLKTLANDPPDSLLSLLMRMLGNTKTKLDKGELIVNHSFALALDDKGEPECIVSAIIAKSDWVFPPSFSDRLKSKGYKDFIIIDSDFLIRLAEEKLVKEQVNA
jgi:hypothetical protein